MAMKIAAIVALMVLPLSIVLWHKSESSPTFHRFDLTLYKSVRIYLDDGICAFRVLSLPTKTASRTSFEAPLVRGMVPGNRSFLFTSEQQGAYQVLWLVFPLWFTTLALSCVCALPVVRGPVLEQWRRARGLCVGCGYDLSHNRSGRCPECGHRWRVHRRR